MTTRPPHDEIADAVEDPQVRQSHLRQSGLTPPHTIKPGVVCRNDGACV